MISKNHVAIYLLLPLLFVLNGCPEDYQFPNRHPEIEALVQLGYGIPIRGRDTLVCRAYDADGDSLIYKWTAPAGTIRGDGDTVIWYAPDKVASYPVFCRVEDGKGGYDERKLTLQVFDYDTLYLSFERLCPPIRMPAETSIIIQDDSVYKSIWEKYHSLDDGWGNPVPPPEVNFDSCFVVCVSYGYGFMSGCNENVTFIDYIYSIRDSVFIHLTDKGLREISPVCYAEIEPRHWAVVPKIGLPICFRGIRPESRSAP